MLRFQCQVVLASSRGHTFSLRIHLGFFRPASVGGPRPGGKHPPTLRSEFQVGVGSSHGETLTNSALRVSGIGRKHAIPDMRWRPMAHHATPGDL